MIVLIGLGRARSHQAACSAPGGSRSS